MANTDFKKIDEYHKAFPEDVQARMEKIRQVINEIVPEAEEVISYQIPAFKYNGYLVYYSAFSKHISLASPWSEALLKHFEAELKDLKTSKSVIQFPHKDPLPLDLIKRILKFRKQENEQDKK